jgi:hypothetical protein
MSTDTHPASPNVTQDNVLTAGPFCKRFGVARSSLPSFLAEGMPGFRLNRTSWIFPADECEAWLRERALLYKAEIKRLVDAAPALTADQADRIRRVLIEVDAA